MDHLRTFKSFVRKETWLQGILMLQTHSRNNTGKARTALLQALWMTFLILTASTYVLAAAPPRTKAYTESICNTDPNVFFCEDFQDSATLPTATSNGSCTGHWNNPAWAHSSYCYNAAATSGAITPTITIPNGVPSSGNQVYKLKLGGNGSGGSTIDGYLGWKGTGHTYTNYYIRWQFYYTSDVQWPVDLDIKQMLSHPEVFMDPPSADYQNGIYIHQDFFCSGLGNFTSVPALRYGPAYNGYPVYNQMCPPLTPGLPADGVHAPQLQVNRWYTIEVHFRLSTDASIGLTEAWLDGNLMYSTHRATCTGSCKPMSYVYFTGWKNPSEPSGAGYVQYDNIIMSTARIGVPNASSSTTPPTTPTGLSVAP